MTTPRSESHSQGMAESTVVVDGLQVLAIERVQPVGNCFLCSVGGADITPRTILVKLDSDPSVVTYSDERAGLDGGKFTFTLSKGEIEVFHVRAETTQVRCQWTATLLLIVEGKRQVIHLDDDGEPFRTSATTGLQSWAWTGERWEGPTA